MLFSIVDPDKFDECLKGIENAFFCLEKNEDIKSFVDNEWKKGIQTKLAEEKQQEFANRINEKELYEVIDGTKQTMQMPYLDSYHTHFLQRKDVANEFTGISSSKNKGNYYHFINVVAALARLIIYFKEPHNVDKVFAANSDGFLKLHELDRELLVYNKIPNMRTFKLMLAGFYHDVGKTITDPRHPMEGAIILAYHTTNKRHKLDEIAKIYNKDFEIKRDDLLYIADLVLFHDQFGTLSTGEDGYMTLVYAIDKIKRYSLYPDPEKKDAGIHCRYERCKKYLFDLWLLNVADIMVSRENKFINQDQWRDPKHAEESINNFFISEKGGRLRHDLEITFDLLKKYTDDGKSEHCDDLTTLGIESHNWSKRHSIERLRRLVTEVIESVKNEIKTDILKHYLKMHPDIANEEKLTIIQNVPNNENDSNKEKAYERIIKPFIKEINLDTLKPYLEKLPEPPKNITEADSEKAYTYIFDIFQDLLNLPKAHWDLLITRCIYSVADFDDFTTRLSWIGKMDYALGFLQKILRQALCQVMYEIIYENINDKTAKDFFSDKAPRVPALRTGWVRPKDKEDPDGDEKSYYKTQAVFFADNFVATMIQILEHLLFRERAIDRLRNIEFNDTRDRLTEDKLNQLLGLEGPFRARRSIQAILQTIYLY